MKNSVLSFLKKNIILILLILNTIFILVFSEVKVSSLYNPKKIFLKTKVITKSILVDLGVLNPYTFPFKNSIKYFKKTIEDEKVVIREIIQDSIPSSLNFLNENQNDFVFHVFDGSKTENMIYYNPQNINYPLNLLNLISLLTVHGNKDSQTTFDEKLKIISCGSAVIDAQVVVVIPGTRTKSDELETGEILVSSQCNAMGYWNKPEETEETFNVYLDDSDRPYLSTGDLGFIKKGEVYVVGRLKDDRFANYSPENISQELFVNEKITN